MTHSEKVLEFSRALTALHYFQKIWSKQAKLNCFHELDNAFDA